ncbi:MAG: IS91 family transposase [Saprospiraceae bacterium]|nr:IS91 family transposase [Saprospiraceae bacterium]
MRPVFEVADVLRAGLAGHEARHPRSEVQRKASNAILNCRTATLGGHLEACTGCGAVSVSYNSCRHRACPKCQWPAQVKWVQERMGELLNTTYFHLVFTVPHALNPLFLSNDRALYNLLMRCAWETLDQLARQPQWLGAQTGMLAVLHTWGQKLDFHPHVHCVVPGGGVLPDGTWKPAKKGFFVPVRVMSALFRGKFLAALKQMRQTGGLEYHGSAAALADDSAFGSLLRGLYKTGWVVYAKAPMGGPAQVLKYLGRYTHRIAISNRRILGIADGKVTFSYKDRQDKDRDKVLTLSAEEFVRRFLLHVLPAGFHKIRHYGLLAARNRKTKLLAAQLRLAPEPQGRFPDSGLVVTEQQTARPCCPVCGSNERVKMETLPPKVFRANMLRPAERAPPEWSALLSNG